MPQNFVNFYTSTFKFFARFFLAILDMLLNAKIENWTFDARLRPISFINIDAKIFSHLVAKAKSEKLMQGLRPKRLMNKIF